jgi:cyclic lactone autoinducer peptide
MKFLSKCIVVLVGITSALFVTGACSWFLYQPQLPQKNDN